MEDMFDELSLDCLPFVEKSRFGCDGCYVAVFEERSDTCVEKANQGFI